MKQQIRQGVFETNSSTVHALSIKKSEYRTLDDLAKHPNLPKHVTLQINQSLNYEDEKNLKTMEQRISAMFNMLSCQVEWGGEITKLFTFFDWLNLLGIGYTIVGDGKNRLWNYGHYKSEIVERFIDDEEFFVSYLTGNIWADSFADDEPHTDKQWEVWNRAYSEHSSLKDAYFFSHRGA